MRSKHRKKCRCVKDPTAVAAATRAATDQPLTVATVQIDALPALARSAKSCANLLCQARAVSVTARWAAIRSSTARRR